MSHTIHLITSYINSQKNYLDTRPQISKNDNYTCIHFIYNGVDIEVCVYNDNFIKLKVDDHLHAICDNIKTFRSEIDRLQAYRYQ